MPLTLTNEIIMEMAKTGVIYGHKKSKTHPRMRPYIAGTRNEIELLDPEATVAGISSAADFLKEKMKNGGLVLLVGTHAAAKSAVESFAKEFNFPYVTSRWLGGTLTNFKVISDRIAYYEDLKSKKEKGEFAKYTKKEQLKFSEKIAKLSKFFFGLSNLKKLPDAVVVIDSNEHDIVIKETKKTRIPIVALIDTDDDPELVEYPIFANDHSKSSIDWVFEKLQERIRT